MSTAPRVKGPQKLGTRGELLRRSETICSKGREKRVSATFTWRGSSAHEDARCGCTYLELVLVWYLNAMLLRGPRT